MSQGKWRTAGRDISTVSICLKANGEQQVETSLQSICLKANGEQQVETSLQSICLKVNGEQQVETSLQSICLKVNGEQQVETSLQSICLKANGEQQVETSLQSICLKANGEQQVETSLQSICLKVNGEQHVEISLQSPFVSRQMETVEMSLPAVLHSITHCPILSSNCGHLALLHRKPCLVFFTWRRSSYYFLHFRTIDSSMLNTFTAAPFPGGTAWLMALRMKPAL